MLRGYLEDHQEVILEKVQAQSWRWLPGWVDRAVARKITAGVLQLLTDLRKPDHPWRTRLGEWIETWISRLADDQEVRLRGELLKQQVLASPQFAAQVLRVWEELRRRLDTKGPQDTSGLEDRLSALLSELGGWVAEDLMFQRTLNTAARAVVRRVLTPRREEIGRFVAQVVEGWDTQGIVDRLELQVGPDLQFIRLNGALVGGLVGLVLFVASRLLRIA